MTTDTSSLSPSDAQIALRSFPRRYRELLQPIKGDERMDASTHRKPPIGRPAFDILVDTTRSLSLLCRALHDIVVMTEPTLHLGVVRRGSREFDTVRHGEVEDVLAELDDVANGFADDVQKVDAESWLRSGNVVGGGTITAIDVLREAVATGADNLREAELTLRQVRGS